jgi:hypothetical protein
MRSDHSSIPKFFAVARRDAGHRSRFALNVITIIGGRMKVSRILLAAVVVLSLAVAGVSLYSSNTCDTACAPCEACP